MIQPQEATTIFDTLLYTCNAENTTNAASLFGIVLEQKLEAEWLERDAVAHEVFRHGFDLFS